MRAPAIVGYGYRYRRWVLDSLEYVDVQDLATGGDHIPGLDDVYVDVALVSRARYQGPGNAFSQAAEDTSERRSLGGLLDSRSRVVLMLVGQSGSGKSTLLAHAARRSIRPSVRGYLGRGHVPILIALRKHAESIVADPEISLPDVVRAAVGGKAGQEPGRWWERQLSGGRCLVLLDGLDEVARPDDRRVVADWVERQITIHARNHFVMASRPYGVPGSLASQADVYVVRPFTPEQIRLFFDQWCLAAERHATGASGRTARRAVGERGRESAARLAALLRDHPTLHDLAVNPLLLTMIATAHRYRGALPGSRADLYGEICQVLLSRRDQAKDLPELLAWPAKQTLLAALAYQMMRDHVTDLPAGRVVEALGPHLERFSCSVTGEVFLDEISRNGLLVEEPAGRYSFTHLTFQEYLAARHVSAGPDLAKSLADNVSDPWWHETILLYTATSDASVIVRACLDDGTLPAITLAFDCDQASAEMDPELRRRLDRERQRAYEPDCSPEHRRLIAGVQAARLVRRTLLTATGPRICVRPVPADLYWLFLADTQAPRPDSPCAPGADLPAAGIWGAEAQAFVTWLNSITATVTGIEVRLPSRGELQEDDIAGVLTRQLPATVTGGWTQPHLELWVRPGQLDPHEVTAAAIRQAIAADAENTAMLPQILTAAVLDVALGIARDLADVRALTSALAGDITARARSEGRSVGLMHAHAHAIVLSFAHALDLTRADAITRTCAADPDLIRTLDLAPARVLAEAIARDVASTIDLAHAAAVELAEAIDLDLSILGAFDFDVGHVLELARAHATALDVAYTRARDTLHAPDLGLADVFGLGSADTLHPVLPLPGILGLPLRWIAEAPFASVLLQVLAAYPTADAGAARPLPSDPYLAFASALLSRAGIHETTHLRAVLGSPLTDRLRDLAADAGTADWYRQTGLGRLTDACAPMCAAHEPPSPSEAAALRAVALALADGVSVPGTDASGVLRAVAATVTAIESRHKGESTTGESIILALV